MGLEPNTTGVSRFADWAWESKKETKPAWEDAGPRSGSS